MSLQILSSQHQATKPYILSPPSLSRESPYLFPMISLSLSLSLCLSHEPFFFLQINVISYYNNNNADKWEIPNTPTDMSWSRDCAAIWPTTAWSSRSWGSGMGGTGLTSIPSR